MTPYRDQLAKTPNRLRVDLAHLAHPVYGAPDLANALIENPADYLPLVMGQLHVPLMQLFMLKTACMELGPTAAGVSGVPCSPWKEPRTPRCPHGWAGFLIHLGRQNLVNLSTCRSPGSPFLWAV